MMKKILALAVMGMVIFGASIHGGEGSQTTSSDKTPEILIAFFSRTNNTKALAEHIQSLVGGDMFHVTTKEPYPEGYRETTRVARAELNNNERPELAETISPEDMEKYDVIFLGYPNWWGTMPMAMFTFLEQYDLSGKTIVPFCTHGGGGLGRGPSDIATLAPNATILKGFAIRTGFLSFLESRASNDVADWLRELGYM
jgi:flavodoxin